LVNRKFQDSKVRPGETPAPTLSEKYKLLAEFGSDIIFLRDLDGVILYVSPALKRHLGWSPEEFLGKPSDRLVYPKDAKTIMSDWQRKVFKEGKTFHSRVRLVHKDGTLLWFDSLSEPILDESGKIIAAVTTSRNINRQVKVEEEKIHLDQIIEESPDEIFIVDPDTLKILHANKMAVDKTGYSLAALKRKTISQIKMDCSYERAKRRLEPIIAGTQKNLKTETQHKKKDGTPYTVESDIYASFTGEKAVLVYTTRDLTQIKKVEERYKLLADNIHDIVVLRKPSGEIQYVTPSVERTLGYTLKEAFSSTTWEFIHPEDRAKIKKAWDVNILEQKKGFNSLVRTRDKKGKYHWLEAYHQPIFNKDGAISSVVSSTRDITSLIEAEKKLQRLSRIVEETLDEIYIFDLSTGKFTYANPTAQKNTGYRQKELVKMGPKDIAVQRSAREIKHQLQELKDAKNEKVIFEGQNRRKDGSVYDVEITAQPFPAEKQNLILIILKDITEKKRSSQAAETANQRFRMFAEHGSDILIQRDPKGVVLYASPSLERHLGWTQDEIIGNTIWHLLDASARDRVPGWKETVFKNGDSTRYQIRVLTKTGDRIWIESATEPVRDKTGEVVYAISTWRNIDEEKKAEEEAIRLAGIVEGTSNEIYIMDSKTLKFTYVNEAGRENLGYSMEELREMTPGDFGAKYSAEEDRRFFEKLKRSGNKEIKIEGKHRRKDGTLYDVALTLQHRKTEDEEAFIAFGEDITEKNKAQELLYQAQKMEVVGQLTGGVAHDFNNLLTTILSSLRLIERGGLSGEMQEILNLAIHSTKRGADLTHRLLAFARKQHLEAMVVNISDALENVHAMLKSTLGGRIAIQMENPKGNLYVKVDPGELENALLNLGINARDAMEKGGHLEITAVGKSIRGEKAQKLELQDGNYVAIKVSDDGIGIPQEILSKVVEPFFTTKEIGQGSGLGLSMVYGFVKQSKGSLEIISENGKGTSVVIYLPKLSGKPKGNTRIKEDKKL